MSAYPYRSPHCGFCDIIHGDAPAKILHRWLSTTAIEPLNPVTPGHTLIIPHHHVESFGTDWWTDAATMRRASELVKSLGVPCNIITSVGKVATQTVPHLHAHIVPRTIDDGLKLPWTDQTGEVAA